MLSAPCPWPPLISTARHPIASNRLPWFSIGGFARATGSSSKRGGFRQIRRDQRRAAE